MRRSASGMLTLMVIASTPVLGQGSLGIGPQLGIYKAQDADDTRFLGGLALRIKLSDALGVEGSINYRREKYMGGAVEVTTWPVMATGLIYPFPALYGAIGAGWYNTTIDYDFPPGVLGPAIKASDTKQEFGWHFGGGVELPVGTAGKLTGDIRYVFLNYDFERVPGSSINNDFYVITVGFLFGLQ